jgi:hypothetical protein
MGGTFVKEAFFLVYYHLYGGREYVQVVKDQRDRCHDQRGSPSVQTVQNKSLEFLTPVLAAREGFGGSGKTNYALATISGG